MADIFRLLESAHRRTLAALDQISDMPAGSDEPARRILVDRLIAAESRHEAAEELAFWPAVRHRLADGRSLSDEGRRQEGDAKFVLDAMRFITGPDLEASIGEAAAMIRRHVRFEEGEVWPALRSVTGPMGAHLLGWRYRAALRAAPSRPHPHGPDGPLGLATVGTATAVGDRLRDRLGGRSRRLSGPLTPEDSRGRSAVEFLAGEHGRIDGLMRRIEAAEWPEDTLIRELVHELSVHDAIERQHLYPAARRRAQGGNDLYDHAVAEHGRIAAVLADIDRRPQQDRHKVDEAKRVVRLVRAHVAEEEGEIFPALKARLSVQEMNELGGRLAAARDRAPTRPHPHAAGSGIGARVVGAVASPLDRARDALTRLR